MSTRYLCFLNYRVSSGTGTGPVDKWVIQFHLFRTSGSQVHNYSYQTGPPVLDVPSRFPPGFGPSYTTPITSTSYHFDTLLVSSDDNTGITVISSSYPVNPLDISPDPPRGSVPMVEITMPTGYLDSIGYQAADTQVYHSWDNASQRVVDTPLIDNFFIFIGQVDPRHHTIGSGATMYQPVYAINVTEAANLTTTKRLLVPVMDADDTAGRVSMALGMVEYEQLWSISDALPRSTGHSVARLSGLGKVTSFPIRFMSSTSEAGDTSSAGSGPAKMPWTTGADIGATGTTSRHYLLPQALFALPQEGIVRLVFQNTLMPPSSETSTAAVSARQWRETKNYGKTWTSAAPPGSVFPYHVYFVEGTRRGLKRVSSAVSDALPAWLSNQGQTTNITYTLARGGAGFISRAGQWTGITRLPTYAAYHGSGTYSAVSSPPNTFAVTYYQVLSRDGMKTQVAAPLPTVGGISGSYVAVPGYPFPPSADPALMGGPEAIPPQSIRSPFSTAGGAAWARGSDQAGALYLFQPFMIRRPIANSGFQYDGKTLAGAFLSNADAETTSSGRDWGTKTGIGWASTSDGGGKWSALGCVTVAGTPLLADTETVRIAAVRTSGGRILLCVCSEGIATLYGSDSGAKDFFAISHTTDGGATWKQGANSV